MLHKIFLNDMAKLKGENALLKFTILVLAMSCVMSAWYSYQATQMQKVVILPPTVDKRIVISGNEVNDDYIKLFTRYAIGLFMSYTPATFMGQAADLLKLSTPDFYAILRKKVEGMDEKIRRLQITSQFHTESIQISTNNRTIHIVGRRKQTAQGQEIDDTRRKYKITYEILNGRFYIDGIAEISIK